MLKYILTFLEINFRDALLMTLYFVDMIIIRGGGRVVKY